MQSRNQIFFFFERKYWPDLCSQISHYTILATYP
uniref:Uncharacterized protein n=1 Tax=Anguilla anguilla TaxID=7936 RepID=A0A0E9W242_ANGAN